MTIGLLLGSSTDGVSRVVILAVPSRNLSGSVTAGVAAKPAALFVMERT